VTILAICGMPANLKAQNCDDPTLDQYKNQMRHFIHTYQAIRALDYSDSVWQLINKRGQSPCENSFWIKFERAEALELERRFEEALTVYFELIITAQKKKWWNLFANAHISLARTYEMVGDLPECHRNLMEAKALIHDHSLDTINARFCARYSSYFRLNNQLDSARHYAFCALKYGEKFNISRALTDGYMLLGMMTADLDSSVFYFRKAVAAFVTNKEFHGAASQNLNIASRLIREDRLTEALKELSYTEYLLERMSDKSKGYFEIKARIHNSYSSVYEKRSQLDSSLFHLKLHVENLKAAEYFIDHNKVNSSTINFIIEKEQEKVKNIKTISLLLQTGLILASISIIVFVFLLRNNNKKKKEISKKNLVIQKQYEQLEASLNKQSLLLAEVHHRVKNNLQLVISMLTLKIKDVEYPEMKQHLEDVSSKVRGIALIHEQLYSSAEFENINIGVYIEKLVSQFQQLNDVKKDFNVKLDLGNIDLNLETVMPIGIICSELIGNSLKYAVRKDIKLEIQIKIQPLEHRFVLKYNDNGPGIPSELEAHQSKMGLKLIRNMVRQLQAESRFYNDNGMCFNMVFVEKHVSKV
jgi:two-component sensor histidine kinase/tetratricopeptide (TPR) repeat protein